MVNPDKIVFPITREQLAQLQRAEVGRELTDTEREFFCEVADMANKSFNAATRGDAEAVQSLLDAINAIAVTDPYSLHLAALCRGWVLLGCQKGAEQLKTTIEGTSYS